MSAHREAELPTPDFRFAQAELLAGPERQVAMQRLLPLPSFTGTSGFGGKGPLERRTSLERSLAGSIQA